MSDIISSLAKRDPYEVKLVRGPGDNPRRIESIQGEIRAIHAIGEQYAAIGIARVQKNAAADPIAGYENEIAAMEYAVERMQTELRRIINQRALTP